MNRQEKTLIIKSRQPHAYEHPCEMFRIASGALADWMWVSSLQGWFYGLFWMMGIL